MYTSFTGSQNLNFLQTAFKSLESELKRIGYPEGIWVCYGSFILNTQTAGSDIDLLYIHSSSVPPQRVQSVYEGHPVTIYCVSREDFKNDGESALYGGYFSGKVLNPYHVFSQSPDDSVLIKETGGSFIAPFAAMMAERVKRETSTATQLLVDSIYARFHICPWYTSYFLRYFTLPYFPGLWDVMKTHMTSFLMSANAIRKVDDITYRYAQVPSISQFHEKTIASVGRFWSIGSNFHENIPDFTGFYIQKASSYVKTHGLELQMNAMVEFLTEQSAI